MRVLVACEFSGTVRDAFDKLGHEAWSCDLIASETEGNHYKGDVLDILDNDWDLMIAHPPCTHLAISGAAWFKKKEPLGLQSKALEFVQRLLDAPIPRIALENPISVISTKIRKPDQMIHPWQFGHAEKKSICLWLKNLPLLQKTREVRPTFTIGRDSVNDGPQFNKMGQYLRQKERSRFFSGIANAMAQQWGSLDV